MRSKNYPDLSKPLNQDENNDLSRPINQQNDYPDLSQQTNMNDETIPTFLGDLPRNKPEFKIVSTENKELIEEMINAGAGMPGINAVGKGISGFGKGIKNVLTKVNPKELSYGVQKSHDKLFKESSDIYDFVKSQVGPRGVSKIDISPEFIKEAEIYLPKTRSSKKLIEEAKSGNYESLHKLQSDLGKRGTKSLGSKLRADRDIGEEMLDLRSKINESISNRFKEYGHEDLAKLLEEGSSKFRKLNETYYSHPAIAKLVHAESRKIPKNPLNIFSEESVPMNRLLEGHPEITKALEINKNSKEFIKKLKISKDIGIGTALGGGSIIGANKLMDYLLNNSK